MRYAASEKLEIIRQVKGSHLSVRQTLAKLGIPRTTFYRWYDRYRQCGEAGLQDWRAPIVWSSLIVSASSASGPSERCFLARVGDSLMRCGA